MRPRASGDVVGVRELKTRLGRYLRQVRQGRTIVVTDRGEPVAEIRPVDLGSEGSEAEIDRLVALGRVTRTSKRPLARFRPIKLNGPPVSEAIVEARQDRL
jgi:prevent-host-death family protein